jgi:C1A family cysteine protease
MTTTESKSHSSSRQSSRNAEISEPAKLRIRRASPHGAYGWVHDLPDARDFTYSAPLFHYPHGLPPLVDLRSECPPIYDQGQLGSCTANGIAAAIEFDQHKKDRKEFVPSRLFIYYNERAIEGTVSQDSGAQIRDGIKSVATLGAPPESDWAYDIKKFAQKPPSLYRREAGPCFVICSRPSYSAANAGMPRLRLPVCVRIYGLRKL